MLVVKKESERVMLWLRRDLFTIPPELLIVEKAMMLARVASSVTEARRLITDGGAYLNNEKITPPGPIREWAGLFIGNGQIIKEKK